MGEAAGEAGRQGAAGSACLGNAVLELGCIQVRVDQAGMHAKHLDDRGAFVKITPMPLHSSRRTD